MELGESVANSITLDDLIAPSGPQAKPASHAITADDLLEDPSTTLALAGSVTSEKPQPAPGLFGSNFGASFKSALIRDPETARREIANSIFPNDPNGAARVGFVNGRPIFVNDQGKTQYVAGGATNFAANTVANLPEIVMGGIGSLSPAPVVTGPLGAAGARGIKNAVTGLAYDEPQTVAGNLTDIGAEATTNAVFGLAGKGLIGAVNRGRVIDLSPSDIAAAQARRAEIKAATGIDVDLALASGDRRLLAVRNYLAQSPTKVADSIQAADEAAATQFDDATRRVVDSIAQSKPKGELGQQGVSAAQDAIKQARKKVSADAKPLYDAAYASMPRVEDPKILSFLELPYFKQAYAKGQKIAALEGRTPSDAVSLQGLDYTKQGLDDIIATLEKAGKRKEAAALRNKKNEFVALLDEGSGDAYKAARAAYAKGIKETVDPLEKGWVGILAKIPNTKVATAAARILGDRNAGPEDIRLVRMSLAKSDPEAWNGLLRQYVMNSVSKAKRVTQGGGEVNVPGKLRQELWGDPDTRARLSAAFGGQDGAVAFATLMDSAEALARAPVRGSNTAPNQQIQALLEGPSGWWAKVLLSPKSTAVNTATQKAVDRNSQLLWEALQNPAKARQLRVAVSISDPAKRAAYISGVILGTGSVAAAGPSLGKGTSPPPLAPQ